MNRTYSNRLEGRALDTELMLCEAGACRRLAAICAERFGHGPYLVISDERIWKAAGPRMESFLAAFPGAELRLLPAEPPPYASDALVAEARAMIEKAAALPIAFGAGTINDVVKRAAFEAGRRYACVPTAPSVDGFAASGAAITVRGFKVTLPCPAPLVIAADEELLAEAPAPMIASGYGDLVAKLTGGADWIVADLLGLEAIDRGIWDLVQPAARAVLELSRATRERDPKAIAALYSGLAMSGIGMQRYGDSRPASGAEHLISHAWEMGEHGPGAPSHGFKVALGTLVMAAFMRELLAPDSASGGALAARGFAPAEGLLERRLSIAGKDMPAGPARERAMEVARAKTPGADELAARARRAKERWPELAAALASQLPSFAELKGRLAEAGCPVEPAEAGFSRESCLAALRVASVIRPRYTVLDVASELDAFEEAAGAALSAPYFSRFA